MNKFKVGDKVLYKDNVYVIEKLDTDDNSVKISDYYLGVKDGKQRALPIKEVKPYKTPHERLLELGFVVDDETNYFIKYVFNGFEIFLYKKEKTYQTYVYQDNYSPIDLQLAEILVDYLKELEND